MSKRVTRGVARPDSVYIEVNGTRVVGYEGESLATALMAAGYLVFSQDSSGRSRSPFCNMGVCFDCMVTIEDPAAAEPSLVGRVRACMTAIRPGLRLLVPDPETSS